MFIANVCDWDAIDYFITDDLPADAIAQLNERGVQVVIA
jgi:DeoR/GlpR family transcriptional regulator of sugar metabolism